ncbi:MAG: hypothetical protein IJT70_06225 [Clostridia bacterium]|nr:hypothetical protein [Clostridia bacterium]
MEKLSGLPIPEFLKTAKDGAPVAEPDNEPADKAEPDDCAPEPDNTNEALSFDVPATAPDDRSQKMQNILKVFRKTVSTSAVTIKRVGTQVASKSEEIIKKKPLLKRQMLFYGVVDFYYNGLEKFMNS